MSNGHCIIVGASHAAAQLVQSLRDEGWEGAITVIGEEAAPPYHRPPLSKDFLLGAKTLEHLLIRPESWYADHKAELRLGQRVEAIDRKAKRITLQGGETLAYDKLALCVGARAMIPPIIGVEAPHVKLLRSVADIEAIRPLATPGKRAAIIGGGYIGLETAASLRKLGLEATVFERESRLLARVASAQLSDFFKRAHEEEGVRIILDAQVSEITQDGLRCADGARYEADLVVLGVGIIPNTELAAEAGLEVARMGISVDAHLRTSDADIVALGDCAWFHHPLYGREMRVESVQNAVDQARCAAKTLTGKPETYGALPWFWSDQFDIKLQIAGLSTGHDAVIARGDLMEGRKFSLWYYRGDRLLAVESVNEPAAYMVGKKLLGDGLSPPRDAVADTSIAPKALMRMTS